MNTEPLRVVLAFYPADTESAETGLADRATRLLTTTVLRGSNRVYLATPETSNVPDSRIRYARLRLQGESLVIAEGAADQTEGIVKTLQQVGTPAIFVVRPDIEAGEVKQPASTARKTETIFAQLLEDKRAFDAARQDLAEAARLEHALTPAAEWIVDNTYLVHGQINEAQRFMPSDYAEWATNGKAARANALAAQLSAKTDYTLTAANIVDCLRQYQKKTILSISELWAFPVFLRIALIQALTHLATDVNRAQQLRESGYLWANRLARAARESGEIFERILGFLETEPFALEPDFITALAEQLQDEETALGPVGHWIEQHFETPLIELLRRQHTAEAERTISTANAFTSLRAVARIDFKDIFEQVCLVEAELRKDPAGIYGLSDFATRNRYLRAIEKIARYSNEEELDVARHAVRFAAESNGERTRHVGYYLIAEGLQQLETELKSRVPFKARILRAVCRHATPAYITAVIGLTACFVALASALAWEAGVHLKAVLVALTVLAAFPLSEFAIQIVHALVISLLPPEPLPKMDFRKGIPAEGAALVAVPILLSNLDVIRAELDKLEIRYLGNRQEHVYFSLLSDFVDTPEQVMPEDAQLLDAARAGIEELNARYEGGHFLLFHRQRVWSESEQSWIGRERKRGKLEDLNAFLRGEGDPGMLITGHLPEKISWVITLDSDTMLPPHSARRLIETISHPLNRVEIDPVTHVRKRGYAIIQPRVGITLPGATATRFTRVFADASGTDPYSRTVSDAQQDLFFEAIFHGKAIYDVEALHTILGGRFPAETLLSHDLIEGAHAGVGLASDVELFENLPTDYGGFATRQHRWIRGDWQIASWVFGKVPCARGGREPNPLSFINRWRIFDNLRRSLVPVAALMLLLLGWLISAAPGVWSLVVGLAIAIPGLAPVLDRTARKLQGSVQLWQGAADELIRAVVMVAFLPHQAWLSVDAIVRVLYRRYFSRRYLLEWTTADHVRAFALRHTNATLRQMLAVSGLSLVLAIVLIIRGAFVPTAVFVALWIASPFLLRWLARPPLPLVRKRLNARERLFLRKMARQTWRFFDDLVGPASHWLPPDNSQLALRIEVAHRTSPTNIGFWLNSALAARDFGYITADDFLRRCSLTMDTLDQLERYEGHLLNWYDTSTLAPILPKFVSTVDSGNLLAALWVLGQGCQDVLESPIIGQRSLRGLSDTLAILDEMTAGDLSVGAASGALRRLLHRAGDGHELVARIRMASGPMQTLQEAQRWHASAGDERSYWASRLATELSSWSETADRYLRWMETLALPPDSVLKEIGNGEGLDAIRLRRRALRQAPSLAALAEGRVHAVDSILAWKSRSAENLRPEIVAWLDQVASEYATARRNAAETVAGLRTLEERSHQLADGINMRFLFDSQRRLFGVGYAVGSPRVFTSHYDLLASECRLASLVALARGDVSPEHWFALSRPFTRSHTDQTLLSWSGTMFEYLMPLIYLRTFSNSLLERACREAVRRQIEYGNHHRIPWGISESAFSAIDSRQFYQYRAFGVPTLALNPAIGDELVVTPYATTLALMIDPAAATHNLQKLKNLGMSGPMGLYEAIDFTRETREGRPGVVVYSYMAHHQGMSLTALANVLQNDVMQRRFHRDFRVRAVESLLFEGVPITRMPMEGTRARSIPMRFVSAEDPAERMWTDETAAPRVHLHGNGRYALMVTNSGGGYSRWNGFDLTRWRSDPALDPWGSFLYVRDVRSGEAWTASHKPFISRQGESEVRFSADRAEFRRRVSGLETILEITVAGEDDVELRRLTVSNRALRSRRLEFTSYMELAMAPHAADKAHPAFSKMFIETEYAGEGVLVAHRRPRSPGEPGIWMAHILVGATGGVEFETDRAKFLGRGNTPENPNALEHRLSGTAGTVVDPILSLRCQLTLDPRDRQELAFITVAASTREALFELIQKYSTPESVGRAFEMAWTRAQLEFRFLGIGPGSAHRYLELASQLIYPNPKLRQPVDRVVRNQLGQSSLWAYGISGDLPILLLTVSDARHLVLVREVLLAHAWWRMRGFQADLVILDQEEAGYDQPLREQILRQVYAHASDAGLDRPGGVFLRDWNAIPEEHRDLMFAAASIVISGNRGLLQQQLAAAGESVTLPLLAPPNPDRAEEPSPPLPFLELPYFNGTGGFTADGREYAIYLKAGDTTPSPWINVMANSGFGALVSESGLGCSWAGNSQSNRLTPWHNDPVSDPQSEVIYLRDDETGELWTPTALPIRENDAYRARHGQGYTVYEHNSHAIGQELTVLIPIGPESASGNLSLNGAAGDPIKLYRLRLRNDSSRRRQITATWFAEWVLGVNREDQQLHVRWSRDEESGALLARQNWNTGDVRTAGGRIAFAASSPKADSWSGDRMQFLGRNSTIARPAALDRTRLDSRPGPVNDPGAALQTTVTLEPGQQTEITFMLGQAESADEVTALVNRYQRGEQVEQALAITREWWDSALNAIEVRTPVLSVDFLLNRWLLYQSLSCRFLARTALYQSSGAFGFRDQLQDSMAFVYALPHLTREHILRSAARQFTEGDVQHWWHADTGLGVRTRCSDDLLWLPYVTAHYVKVTGDSSILYEEVPFLDAPPLGAGELERMFTPAVSSQSGPVWEHCRRALERGYQLGQHGLPLFGNGDWNDGMNLVGAQGKGESVWLGWFLCSVLTSFADVMEDHVMDHESASKLARTWRKQATALAAALENSAWDGEWYLRGFFDDGSALGSHTSKEARIDSLPQSWAVISGAADPSRARRAMESAERHLVKSNDNLVLLFTPPFDHSTPNPGYVMGYPPGLRENGGQYTHGSLWLPMAWARLGDGNRAAGLLQMMNPVERNREPEEVARYQGEPYAVAGDVSAAAGRYGRSGWTWYTGAAGWMYRIWIEEVLGFRLEGDRFTINPVLPDEWTGFEMKYRHGSTTYEITVRKHEWSFMELDGEPVETRFIPLRDSGGIRKVSVGIGRESGARLSHPAAEFAEAGLHSFAVE